MVQYYNSKEISEKLEKQLNICGWKSINNGELFEVELPVVLYFNYQRLVLFIKPVYDDGEAFIEHSNDAKYYYDLFNEKDSNYHYDIELDNNHFYKKYRFDYSLTSAIDEFIRFFVFLDEFMRKNDIV